MFCVVEPKCNEAAGTTTCAVVSQAARCRPSPQKVDRVFACIEGVDGIVFRWATYPSGEVRRVLLFQIAFRPGVV